MTSILITGTSRGIGLELVKQLASHPNHPDVLIATCREPGKASELQTVAHSYPFVKVLQLDVVKVETFPEFVSQVSSIIGNNGLNILINNAGVALIRSGLEETKYEDYEKIFKTNVFAPVFLTQALLPLLKKAGSLKPASAKGINQVAVLNISSLLGSVSNKSMVVWGYNESKSALNQITRSMAASFEKYGILAATIHPGWVKTDMGGPQAPLTLDDSGSGLIKLIYDLSPNMNDKFLGYDGNEIPW